MKQEVISQLVSSLSKNHNSKKIRGQLGEKTKGIVNNNIMHMILFLFFLYYLFIFVFFDESVQEQYNCDA